MIHQVTNLRESTQEIYLLIRFLEKIRLKQLLTNVKDAREKRKTSFPSYSLLLYALCVFLFRMNSKNNLETCFQNLKNQKNMLFFLQCEQKLPVIKTVDDFLKKIKLEDLNELLLNLFLRLRLDKVFYNHLELLEGGSFHLGCDGVHIHTYYEKHDSHCPYCLKRERKEKDKTIVFYFHTLVLFVLIFPCGFKLPLYVYPIHAKEIKANLSEEKFKQECELIATLKVLPILRKKLPRLPLTLLLDGLYAKEPVLKLANSLRMNYLIVKKEGSFKTINKRLDELSQLNLYQKHYTKKEKLENGIERTYQWFNGEWVKGTQTHILRFEEYKWQKDGTAIRLYKGEWLSSKRITPFNCHLLAKRARMRWEQEDINNTAKNRGFNLMHGYARKDPCLIMVWVFLLFIALFIFEVFCHLRLAKQARGRRSVQQFAKDLFAQLILTDKIFLAPKIRQFRFSFSGVPP